MFVNELHSMLVHLGRLVVNDGRMLMCPDGTTLMLLVLAIRLAHNPGLSLGWTDSNGDSNSSSQLQTSAIGSAHGHSRNSWQLGYVRPEKRTVGAVIGPVQAKVVVPLVCH
jgi:hypothetical protein